MIKLGCLVFFLIALMSSHAQTQTIELELPPPQPHCQNGQPFTTGTLSKLIGSCPFDKPPEEKWNGKPDGFFSFGDGNRTLHPTKKAWVIFIGAHAALWGSTIKAVRNPHSHEHSDEYAGVIFMTGMDVMAFKVLSPVVGVGAPVWGVIHYLRAAAK